MFDDVILFVYISLMLRVIVMFRYYVYIKIVEGCNNRCFYCFILFIRGKYISRFIEDIVKEVKELVKKGY